MEPPRFYVFACATHFTVFHKTNYKKNTKRSGVFKTTERDNVKLLIIHKKIKLCAKA